MTKGSERVQLKMNAATKQQEPPEKMTVHSQAITVLFPFRCSPVRSYQKTYKTTQSRQKQTLRQREKKKNQNPLIIPLMINTLKKTLYKPVKTAKLIFTHSKYC